MKHGSAAEHHALLRSELLQGAYSAFFTNSPDLAFIISSTGEITEINPAGAALIGQTPSSLTGTPFLELVADSAKQLTQDRFHGTLAGATSRYRTTLVPRSHNTPLAREIPVEVLSMPVFIDDEVVGVYGTARDLTDSIAAENILRDTEQRYHSFYTAHTDPIFTLDTQGCFTHMNPAAESLLGHSTHYLMGQKLTQFVLPELRATTERMFAEAQRGRESRHETTVIVGNGRHVHLAITAVRAGTQVTPAGLHCVARDVSRELQVREDLQRMAYVDFQTNLPNRYGLDRDLQSLFAAETPFCLIATDLDRFKNVNDSWGRGTGDHMIFSVSQRISAFIPQNATIYRYTGDQFFIVLRTGRPSEASRFVHELLSLFEAPFAVDGHSIRTTLSCGAAFFPGEAADPDGIVKNAEFALLTAKEQGRNRVVWHAELEETPHSENAELALALREAAGLGELSLVYQPQIDLHTGAPFGAEALLRWNSPAFGQVPPDRFIPIAEQSGLIVEIGSWALRTACSQYVEWSRAGVSLPHISVNISMHQFYNPDFIGLISRTLQETGMHPEQLVLEVTESVASEHATVVQRMQEVIELGVRLALDDFGTGFSSLASLQEFPLHIIKVDRSFVQHLPNDHTKGLAATVLTLAHSLGFQAIAEGIETEEQLERLRGLGADIGQGYLMSRPLPPDLMTEWLLQAAPATHQ